MQLIGANGHPIDVPDADVPKAFLEQGAGLAAGTSVPMVAPNGQVGHVPAEKAQQAFASGARVATPEEIHKADIHHEYDNFAGYLAAGAAEAGNQAMLGAGDALALGAAKAIGGDKTEAKLRQTLSDLREENPTATTIGGVAGALVPALATGGESALAEGAVEGGSGLFGAVRTALGAPGRALEGAGGLAEDVARAALPDHAATLTGRIAQGAAMLGARGAAEGAILNAGNELSEEMLGDPELSGEKLLAALGHGALLGGATGGLLSTTGELGREVLGRLRPTLDRAAGEQAFRALNPERRFVKLAEKIDGGAEGVGRELLDRGIIDAGDKIDEIAPKVAKARDEVGEKLGAMMKELDDAGIDGPSMARIERVVQSHLSDLRKMPSMNAGAISKAEAVLRDLRSLAEKGTPYEEPDRVFKIGVHPSETEAPRATKPIGIARGEDRALLANPNAGIAQETKDMLAEHAGARELPKPIQIDATRPGHIGSFNPELGGYEAELDASLPNRRASKLVVEEPELETGRTYGVSLKDKALADEVSVGRGPLKVYEDTAATEAARKAARGAYDRELKMNFTTAREFRSSLDDLIKWNTNPLQPVNETVEALKDIRNAIESSIEDAGEVASEKMGREWGKEYKAAKLSYRRLAVADQAAENATAALVANRVIAPSDYLAGIAGFAGGGVHGGLAGMAMGAIHHVIRERGNSTAAILLKKASVLGAIQRATNAVDTEVNRGIAGILEPGQRAPVKMKTLPFAKADEPHTAHANAVVGATTAPDTHSDAIERAVAPIADHAPQIAKSFQKAALRTTMGLANSIPKGHLPPPSITPQFDKPIVTDNDKQAFELERAMSHDPVGTTFSLAAKGMLTKSAVETFQRNSPALYQDVVSRTQQRLATLKEPLSSTQEQQLRVLMGMPAADPKLASILAQTYVAPPGQEPNQGPKAKGPHATPKQREGLANRERLAGLNDEGDM